MNCLSCGHPLDATSPTCPRCGQAVEYHAPSHREPEAAQSPWAPPGDQPGADEPTTQVPAGTEPVLGAPPDREPTVELPADGLGDPGQYLAGTHQPPVRQYFPVSAAAPGGTPSSSAPRPSKRRRLALPILLLALVLVAAGGGVAVAGYYLGWFGRGTQPSDLMPAATAIYVQIDLDPSLSQKSQAWEFLRDLPQVKKAVAAGQPDPKRLIWDALLAEDSITSGTDYDTDIKPWLGNRVGLGFLAHDGQLAWTAVIQVTDEALAAERLQSWIDTNHQDADVTTRDGYATVTARADTDLVAGELTKGTLSSSQTFRSDMAALGDAGVLAAWADLTALAEQGVLGSGQAAEAAQGRVAVALRFATDTLALEGRFFAADAAGAAARSTPGTNAIGTLPEGTGAAITVSGGAEAIRLAGSTLPGSLDDLVSGSGLEAADLEALLGRSLTFAAPTTTVAAMVNPTSSAAPAVGVRIVTDDVARAQAALRRLIGAGGAGAQVFDQVDADVLTAATTQDYLAELRQPSAELSGYGPFAKALPGHAEATAALYLNLTPLVSGQRDFGEYREFVGSLQSAGAEVTVDGEGAGSWSVRLVRS